MGAVVTPLGGRDFGGFIQTEMTKWSGVIAKANIKFE